METTKANDNETVGGLKAVQASRIRDGFLSAPLNGHTTSSGIRVDAKRDDIDNLTRLRNRMLETEDTTTILRDYDNQFHTVTVEQLSGIVGELVDLSLGLFARKWELESALAAAETEEEVLAVVW